MARYNAIVLLAKRETTYGTDVSPSASADAMVMRDVTWTPMEASEVTRTRVRPYYGNDPVSLVEQHTRLAGTLDLTAGGSAGTIPKMGVLLRACGLSEIVATGDHTVYVPVTGSEDSASLYHHTQGTQQKGLGARGDFSIELNAGQIPALKVDMQAFYVAPTAVSFPAANLGNEPDAVPLTQANTISAQLNGNDIILRSLTYKHGNLLVVRDLPNSRAIRIVDRQPSATITFEAPDAMTPDYFGPIGTRLSAFVKWKVANGQAIDFGVNGQLLKPRYVNENNIRMLQFDIRPTPTSAGNDEIALNVY